MKRLHKCKEIKRVLNFFVRSQLIGLVGKRQLRIIHFYNVAS